MFDNDNMTMISYFQNVFIHMERTVRFRVVCTVLTRHVTDLTEVACMVVCSFHYLDYSLLSGKKKYIIIFRDLFNRHCFSTYFRYKGYFISIRFMDGWLLNITHYQRLCHQCYFNYTMVNLILYFFFFKVGSK